MFTCFCSIWWDILPQPSVSIPRLLSIPWWRHQKSRDLMKLWVWGWEIEGVKKEEMGCQDHSTNVVWASMVFLAVIYGCESWTMKKAECWRIDALNCLVEEDSLDFLGLQRDQTSQYPKGNHYWIFIGRTDVEAPILWPPDLKSQFIGKDPDAGKG